MLPRSRSHWHRGSRRSWQNRRASGSAVDLVDDDDIDPSRREIGEQLLQSGPIDRGAGEPAVVISLGQAYPTLVPLAVYEGLAGLTLRLQRIELLLEPLLGRFASIDRASDGSVPPRAVGCWPRHRLASGKEARPRLLTPKNRGPDQCVPVIRWAITVSER